MLADVRAFNNDVIISQFVPSAPASDAVVNKFVGTSAVGQGIEAQLDIQYIMGVAPGVKTDFYEQMNQDFCADLKNWTSILLVGETSIPPLATARIHSRECAVLVIC